MIVHAHQFGSLVLPKSLNIGVGETTKKLKPPGEKLSLVWIIEIAISTLAGISLLGVVDGKRLILDIDDSANFTGALIKYLFKQEMYVSK